MFIDNRGEKVPTNQEPHILKLFRSNPRFDLYKACVDGGGIFRVPNSPFQEIASNGKTDTAIETLYPELQTGLNDQIALVNEVNIPSGFDFEKEDKNAVNSSLQILYSLDLINTEVFRDLSRLVSAKNTYDTDGSFFDKTLYRKIIESGGPHIPASNELRDKYIKIGIGKNRTKTNAAFATAISEMQNLPMSPEKALKVGIALTAGHEIGHALQYAVDVNSPTESLQQRAEKFGFFDNSDGEYVFGERFAMSVAFAVTEQYLKDTMGYSEGAAKTFLQQWVKIHFLKSQQARDFIKHLQDKGFARHEVNIVEDLILDRIQTKDPSSPRSKINNFLGYYDLPFSSDQMKKLLVQENTIKN